MLEERNTRTGFFEPELFRAVLRSLPEDLKAVFEVAYVTGWRVKSEILTRPWDHVDFKAGWLRLESGESKNAEGRMFPLTPDLRAALQRQRTGTDATQKGHGSDRSVRLPPQGAADQVIPPRVADGLQSGRMPRPHSARLPAHSRQELGASWRPALGRPEDGRPQDGKHLPPLAIVSESDLRDSAEKIQALRDQQRRPARGRLGTDSGAGGARRRASS